VSFQKIEKIQEGQEKERYPEHLIAEKIDKVALHLV